MKRFNFTILILSLFCSSCSFLDFDECIDKEPDFVFGYFDELQNVVSDIYSYLPADWGCLDGALREAATDNATYLWSDSKVYDIYNDAWSPSNPVDDVWNEYYSAIRSINAYFRDFSTSRFDKFANEEDIWEEMSIIKNYRYELLTLKSYFYFELLKRYKNIPLAEKIYEPEELSEVKQAPVDSVMKVIVACCDSGIVHLPDSYKQYHKGDHSGRVTKGAALAIKSRALLYAASPLLNDDPSKSEVKWHEAAQAAWDLISYSQENDIYKIGNGQDMWGNGNAAFNSKQLIMERRGGDSNSYERTNLPAGFEGGNTGNCPTQNLVDAIEMADGSSFDWNNPVMANHPYLDRDPRLEELVLHNQSQWKGVQIETFMYGTHGQPADAASLTGYYMKKYMDEDVDFSPYNWVTKPHHYILYRYAEVLLNYAEALFSWTGNPYYTDSEFTMSPVEAVNLVRARVNMPALPADMTPDEFQSRYRNERRVELAFEDHRFWDIRRWMIGPETTDIYGIRIINNGDGTFTHEKVKVQERKWDDKMYLYPISQSELMKNPDWVQNPGW